MAATLYTIGFTKSSAERFFERLRQAGIRRLVDIRLNNTSTLAGFTKKDDLAFFLRTVWNLDIEYVQEPLLAPNESILQAYRARSKRRKDAPLAWDEYVKAYERLLVERDVAGALDRATFEGPTVLLCSEATAEHCHRRLAAEHLRAAWGDLEIVHL